MFDYLQQFNNLPKDLRDKVSSPEAMEALAVLEKKYQVELAVLVMKVMVKSLPLKSLPSNLIEEFNLEADRANKLAEEMTEVIFRRVADHLQLKPIQPTPPKSDNLEVIIKEAGVILPSSDLLSRFKVILSTYLKGVRSKIATRDALAKDINLGGLNLSSTEIDRIFKACEHHSNNNPDNKISLPSPSSVLDKIIAAEKNKIIPEEYDFKKALASGQIKRPAPKLESPEKQIEIASPKEKKSLEAPEVVKKLEAPEKIILPEIVPAKEFPKKDLDIKSVSEKAMPVKTVAVQAPEKKNDGPASPSLNPEIQPNKINSQIPQPKLAIKASPSEAAPIKKEVKPSSPRHRFSLIPSWLRRSSSKEVSKEADKKVVEKAEQAPIKKVDLPQNKKENREVDVKKQIFVEENIIKKDSPVKAPESQSVSRPPFVASARPASHLRETASKPVMHDVKPAPRVMGPIEELQFLDLVNFRRLGKNPEEISAKIFSKIKLLEADGYDKMIAGVRAWRRSPVNLLYLKMMKEAISKGQTIKDFATSVQNNKDNYLSLEEIEGIIAMNSKLIF